MGRKLGVLLLCLGVVTAVPTKGLRGDGSPQDFWNRDSETSEQAGELQSKDADENSLASSDATLTDFFAEEPHPPREASVRPVLTAQTPAFTGQEESGVWVVLVVCIASFFSVYVIYRLFGARKPRRHGQAHEMRTYNRLE